MRIAAGRLMIEAARKRCAGLPNVRLLVTSGRDLAAFADRAFDAVVAVDSFPYLYASGIAPVAIHIREAARVLRPGGDLVILNLSYRGDIEADRRDVRHLAAEAGLTVLRNGESAFRLWDGLAFHLRRSG
jgi:SAM-dependent methyltransferase